MASYRVSPYLQEIPRERVSGFDRALLRGGGHAIPNESAGAFVFALTSLTLTEIPISLRDMLEHAKRTGTLVPASDDPAIKFAVEHELLFEEEVVLRWHRYRQLEVEINRHCNYRCKFCPVEMSPKPRAFMSPDVYALILERAKEYGSIETLSLNHYSEPTLDPDLVSRIELAALRGFKVDLYTNASLLTEERIGRLGALSGLRLIVNLPSADRATYEQVTGVKLFDRVLQNLKWLHQYEVPTTLCVNTPLGSAGAELQLINEEFREMFGPTFRWATDDRAGILEKPQYFAPVKHLSLLNGCGTPLHILNVSYEGKAFLCCQDFNQDVVLGDLRTQSISEIGGGDAAVRVRRWLLGYERPPTDFLCTRCSQTREKTDVLSFGTIPTSEEGGIAPFDWPYEAKFVRFGEV